MVIKNQIKSGQSLRRDAHVIRNVFKKHAQESKDEIESAHILKNNVLAALQKLGVEIKEDDFEKQFHRFDENADGYIDEEEFKQFAQSQSLMPSHDQFKDVFDKICKKSIDPNALHHIPMSELLLENLEELGMTQKRIDIVREKFENDKIDQIDFDEFHQAVLSTYVVIDDNNIRTVFRECAAKGTCLIIPREKIRPAFQDLGLVLTEDHMHDLIHTVELTFNGRIDFHAFKHIVLSPSPAVTWAKSLPIAALLADAMPKHEKCDHLRVISTLNQKEIGFIVEEVCSSLKDMLASEISKLKVALRVMDDAAATPEGHSVAKYAVAPMKAGDIKQFHEGLRSRIGEFLAFVFIQYYSHTIQAWRRSMIDLQSSFSVDDLNDSSRCFTGNCPSNFFDAMEAEHCSREGCNYTFETSNYTKLKTHPKKEWEIVLGKMPCPKEDMKGCRRIPKIKDLLLLPLANRSDLKEFEVIAVVLYSGPMVRFDQEWL
jgi:Ca2+-binding EF-hand superfamily protein